MARLDNRRDWLNIKSVALFTIQNEFRYEIVRKIFEGGMGVVYEAEQHGARGFVKRVAIKVVRQNYANQKQFIDNFIGEAKLVADLIHTNIVQTYHLGETRGIYFIAMELIRGVNLEQFAQQLIDKQRLLPKELAVFIVSRVARGLAYAHAKSRQGRQTAGHRPSRRQLQKHHDRLRRRRETDRFRHRQSQRVPDRQGRRSRRRQSRLHESRSRQTFKSPTSARISFPPGVVLAHLLLGQNLFKGANAGRIAPAHDDPAHPRFPDARQRIDERLNEILHRALARDLDKRYADRR